MGCFVVTVFVLKSASRGPSPIAELLVLAFYKMAAVRKLGFSNF